MNKIIGLLAFVFRKAVALAKIIGQFFVRCVRAINRKKRYAVPFYAFIIYVSAVIIIIKVSGDPDFEKAIPNKRVNDVTQLNPIQVGREIQPTSIDEIVEAIQTTTGPISIGGGRFSMGGQTGYENSLHIDMRKFN